MDSLFFLLSVWSFIGSFILQATGEQILSCPVRIAGSERKLSCPKSCRQDRTCPNKRRCVCYGQCGFSCVAPGHFCPWPLPPGSNTVAHLLSPVPSFSALIEIHCKPGFAMAAGSETVTRRCQTDGEWSGEDPVCTAVPTAAPLSCPLPEEAVSRFTLQGSTAVGSSLRYGCRPGLKLVGNSENFCQENQTWQYPHPICQRLFCPPPSKVDQAHLVAVKRREYDVGTTVYYLCKKPYLLEGSNNVTCLSDGTWSPVPFCRARCTVPAQRSRVVIGGVKLWPYEIPDGLVQHRQNVTFYCKHAEKLCSYTAAGTCFDGELPPPDCYMEPTWLQYQLFPHRLVSEITLCDPGDHSRGSLGFDSPPAAEMLVSIRTRCRQTHGAAWISRAEQCFGMDSHLAAVLKRSRANLLDKTCFSEGEDQPTSDHKEIFPCDQEKKQSHLGKKRGQRCVLREVEDKTDLEIVSREASLCDSLSSEGGSTAVSSVDLNNGTDSLVDVKEEIEEVCIGEQHECCEDNSCTPVFLNEKNTADKDSSENAANGAKGNRDAVANEAIATTTAEPQGILMDRLGILAKDTAEQQTSAVESQQLDLNVNIKYPAKTTKGLSRKIPLKSKSCLIRKELSSKGLSAQSSDEVEEGRAKFGKQGSDSSLTPARRGKGPCGLEDKMDNETNADKTVMPLAFSSLTTREFHTFLPQMARRSFK
ncbi:beta-2-glycoprotein 1-like [Arapaima gigas]